MKLAARLARTADSHQPAILARLEKEAKEQLAGIMPDIEKAASAGQYRWVSDYALHAGTVRLLQDEGLQVTNEAGVYFVSWEHLKNSSKRGSKRTRKH